VSPAQTADSAGPAALRIQLGGQLRALRKAKRVSRQRAGWEIRASESKISRMELGRVPFKERDVADLLTLYGVADDDRNALLRLARQASASGWWQQFGDVVPSWFLSYLGLEESASLIRTYEVQFVPGLLQTADYARAVIQLGHHDKGDAEIEKRTELRRYRQNVLRRSAPPQLWAVIDEAVLRRRVGSRAVMREQVESLIEATRLPHVRLQVIPFDAGGHAPAGCPFAILRFPERGLPDVVYVEQPTSAVYLDKPADVDHYAVAMERACLKAEPPDRTAAILGGMLPII
jgi:Domain of unknown function (DUF5753)/Helix-turn-helix domain